eukprot:354699_1
MCTNVSKFMKETDIYKLRKRLKIQCAVQIIAGVLFFMLGIVIAVIIEGIFDLELILFPAVVFSGVFGLLLSKMMDKTNTTNGSSGLCSVLVLYIVFTFLSHFFVAINYILAAFIGYINTKYKYMVVIFIFGAMLWILTSFLFIFIAVKSYKVHVNAGKSTTQQLNELA